MVRSCNFEYSHLWLISAFHEHLELPFRPLHSPPRLVNEKVGAFSARSPHRPIGLSLSKIHHVDIWKGQIHLRGTFFQKINDFSED